MKRVKNSTSLLPKQLPWMAVLGLSNPTEGDWAQLRGLQYANLTKASAARIAANCIGATVALLVLAGAVHAVWLFAWVAILAVALADATRCDRSLADADHRVVSRAEINRHTISAIGVASAWVIPLAMSYGFLDEAGRLEIWSIVAMMLAATMLAVPSVPLGNFLSSAILGLASTAGFVLYGPREMALVTATYCGTLMIGTLFTARNHITTRIAEAGVAETEEVVSLLLREFEEEGEADWLWQIDTARRVRAVSPRFAFALSRDPTEIDGKPFIQLIAGEAWETGQFPSSLHDLAERLKRRESFSNLLVRVSINGALRWWELSGTPKIDDSGSFDGFRGVGSDVTEQRESSDKIAYLARYDTLTGLPNRMMLTEAMGEAMRYAEQWRTRCAFLMIDLDRFKAVNDTLGHLIGDKLLARVSERLREQITENELCGRLGGDEFAIVVRDATDLGRVETVAQRVIERLSQPYEVDHHTLYVGASVGSAIGPRDGSTVETLMRNADLALYRAKDEGGGMHFTYEPSLHAHAEERRRLEFSLRRALERSEFVLHYQPVVSAETEGLVSFEALIRWNSEEHGFVSPAKFIPLAEDTRLIVPIGEWVLREACRQTVLWPPHVKVAVNVSGEQLLDSNFIASVVGALSQSGLPANRLEIEVTESIFVRDASHARSALEQVMALGCSVALDDFGTGYSSLAYIRNLRFSTIKADRSFVQGAATGNPESLAIIRAVVAMADSLEMSTTAEGVENEAELDIVRKLGCKKIQGYYFGRPMSVEDCNKLMMRGGGGSRLRVRSDAA